MEICFPNVPNLGDLCLEHVFYEYEEPVLFVCLDQCENRYLCSCSRLSEQWLIGRITDEQLLNIIDKSLAIDRFFHTCGFVLCVHWDGEKLHYTSDLPADAFPRTNSFLRLSSEQTREYRRVVQSSSQATSSLHFVSAAAYGKESDIEYIKSLAKCLSVTSTEILSAFIAHTEFPFTKTSKSMSMAEVRISIAPKEIWERRNKFVGCASTDNSRLESDLGKNSDLLHAA